MRSRITRVSDKAVIRSGVALRAAVGHNLLRMWLADGGLHICWRVAAFWARSRVSGGYMARLLSVNVGMPRDIDWKGRAVRTGIWKEPVHDRCWVGRLNLAGDGQGDLAGHGGAQRAVFVYQIESYRH